MDDLYQRLKPLGRILNLKAKGWTVWDCAPILGPDGRVHVFASRWHDHDRPDAAWFVCSQIIHAVADQPAGPYTVVDVVIDANGNHESWDASGVINAKIVPVEGRFALMYTGTHSKRHDMQTVGMRVADSLDGPWQRVTSGPLIAPESDRGGFDGYLCNNPTLVRSPDGSFHIYYKGRPVTGEQDGKLQGGAMTIGVATAKRLEGPYHKHPGNPVVAIEGESVEDPFVWHDGSRFNMIVSRLGHCDPAGYLLTSDDGLEWSTPRPAYPSAESFLGRAQRLEEPNLLFDADGRPTHLFNVLGACPADPVYSGFVFEIA